MSYTASELIAIAKAEVGYLEKATNKDLDSKTGNAGKNNYTKYARDLHKAGYYQASKQGFAWCDMFVDWCHWIASGKDPAEAQRVICQTGPYGAGCTESAQYYKNQKRLFQDPKPGDQIFFWDSKKTCVAHTGIVSKVDSTYVYTIEGNTSGAAEVVANGGGVFETISFPRGAIHEVLKKIKIIARLIAACIFMHIFASIFTFTFSSQFYITHYGKRFAFSRSGSRSRRFGSFHASERRADHAVEKQFTA